MRSFKFSQVAIALALTAAGLTAASPVSAKAPFTDLAIEAEASATRVKRGETVTYLLKVVNRGPAPAREISVANHVPEGLTVLAVRASQGTCRITADVACSIEELSRGSAASIEVDIRADRSGVFSNDSRASTTTEDRDLSNNSASLNLDVVELQTLDEQLDFVRILSEKYKDVSTATDAGFERKDHCVDQRDLQAVRLPDLGVAPAKRGAMGYHHYNPGLVDRSLDLARPEAMIYAPTEDGGRVLAAIEYIFVDQDQNLATVEQVPDLFLGDSDVWAGPMQGHGNYANGEPMPIHYDLHVWVWRDNPDGMFAPYNPSVHCPHSMDPTPPHR